jgi:hypothetical protein
LELRRQNPRAAAAHFERAMQLADMKPEREFLASRRESCGVAIT